MNKTDRFPWASRAVLAVPAFALFCVGAEAQLQAPAAQTGEPAVASEVAEPADAAAAEAEAADGPAETAETVAEPQQAIIEEIVVTSQKRAENIQDVPIAVSALSGDSLAAAAIDAQYALPQITPNLQVSSSANFTSPYLRGVGTQYANPGLESSVATYFDDQYLSRASANLFSFSDVDHIEVLKGPQGTLYGRNATGGAIRIISKEPTQNFEAKSAVTFGNYGRLGAEGMISGALAPTLLNRLVVQYDSNDGYVDNIDSSKPKLQDRNQYFLRNKTVWNPAENLKAKLTLEYGQKKDHEGQAFINLDPAAPTQTGLALGGTPSPDFYTYTGNLPGNNDGAQKLDTRNKGAVLRVDYDLEALTLSSISGFREVKFHGPADLDSTDAALLHATTVEEKTVDFSQELQAVSNGDGPLKWVGGIYYLREKATDDFGLFGQAIGPGAFVGGRGKVSIYSLAPYGQVSYTINPKWEATLGARYTLESKKLLSNRLYQAALGSNGVDPTGRTYYFSTPGETNSFQQFSPKAVISYKPNEDAMLYASVSRGFKSGGFNLPVPTAQTVDSVDPETLTAYELGWKTEFDRLRVNGAAFYYDYKDLQVQTTDATGGSITKVANAASATIKGVEIDLTYALTRQLELGTGAGYLDASFDRFIGESYVPNFGTTACQQDPAACVGYSSVPADLSGQDLPLAPEFTGYVRARYSVAAGPGLGLVSFNPVYSYSSKYNYTSDGSVKEPSKGLLNASIVWTSEEGHYDLTLFGSNLTDEKYYQSRTRFPSMGGWQVPAPPLQYGLRLSYTF